LLRVTTLIVADDKNTVGAICFIAKSLPRSGAGPCQRGYNMSMSRWVAIAALGAAFLAMPAWAQRRGGGFGGGGGHASFGSHGAIGGMRGPATGGRSFGGFPRGGMRAGPGFHGRPFGPRPGFFPGRPFFHHRYHPGYYGYGYGYSYPWWGWYGDYGYDDYGYDSPYYYPSDNYSADDYAHQNDAQQQQQAEIDRLNDEVARLREERQARSSNPPQPAVRVWTDADMTRLVFRDKHTEEIRNYAIVGQTLWVFTEDRTKRITLAELDLPATKKANEDRGVDFQIPR